MTARPKRWRPAWPAVLRTCPAHGTFEGARCPSCGHEGSPLLDEEQRTRLSKFLSGALRHFPGDVGLEPDERGFVDVDALLAAARERYGFADEQAVEAVLALDPKGRFEIDEEAGRVRAVYGHSIQVDLSDASQPAQPSVLYHGTAPENVASIREEGLVPMDRQEVHLSPDVETALKVGRRHADEPVLLRVDAEGLREAGIEIHRRAATVYTCKRVPARFVEVEGRDR